MQHFAVVVLISSFINVSFTTTDAHLWTTPNNDIHFATGRIRRGGSSSTGEEIVIESDPTVGIPVESEFSSTPNDEDSVNSFCSTIIQNKQSERRTSTQKTRHVSDMIIDLKTRSAVYGGSLDDESQELRDLITERTSEYLQDLSIAVNEYKNTLRNENDNSQSTKSKKLPHPKKLLHYLVPKIPAVKHSPDVGLRIRSARSDIDSGIAACLIGTIGHVCEIYETTEISSHITKEIVNDRRFEQLVECILCGVDVKKRMKEWKEMSSINATVSSDDLEELVEEAHFQEGLSIRDSCRAAWGVSILGVHSLVDEIGGTNVTDLLLSLALRIRELLLVRLQKLRDSDLSELDEYGLDDKSIDDQLMDFSEELAEDAATAMWTFGCVMACTGIKCHPLFDICCSILCTNPYEFRMKAQDIEANEKISTLGSNDIVERLAKAEHDNVDDDDGMDSDGDEIISNDTPDGVTMELSIQRNDALVDWLSSKELTDTVWAFALHGTREPCRSGEIDIQETFRDVAFDRILHWLHQEVVACNDQTNVANETVFVDDFQPEAIEIGDGEIEMDTEISVDKDMFDIEQGESALEVDDLGKNAFAAMESSDVKLVDAAEIVKSEQEEFASTLSAAVESITVEVSQNGGVQEVELVDASTLLAMEEEAARQQLDGLDDENNQFTAESQETLSSSTVTQYRPFTYFSPHDLCSIAWAATELNDSVRDDVVAAVLEIFGNAGPHGLDRLSGGDLSNLAWAIAKNVYSANKSLHLTGLSVLVMGWIVDEVLQSESKPEKEDVFLYRFHPPEFSRLLWAIASVHTSRVDGTRMTGGDAHKLCKLGLIKASQNLEMFSVEDLARIVWAFLAVGDDSEQQVQRLSFAEALVLGKLLSTVETCLIQWESNKLPSQDESAKDGNSVKEATRFTTFFGRTRRHVRLLDQRLDESGDEEEYNPLAAMHGDKARLPLLRDLPIDPLTLCKLACCFERLAKNREGKGGSPILTRVALRLLTSRSGRLMRECPIQDLVRISEAAARSDLSVVRESISHFARRLVCHLNGHGQESLNDLSVGDFATFIWVLGELGVKYTPFKSKESTAHRRLNFAGALPFPDDECLPMLSNASVVKMLKGLVALNVVAVDQQYLLKFLRFLKNRAHVISDESELCEIIQSVGALKKRADDTGKESDAVLEVSDMNTTMAEDPDNIVTADDRLVSEKDISTSCSEILSTLGTKAASIVDKMQAETLRNLLSIFTLLSLPDDNLIDSIEKEVLFRKNILEASIHCDIEAKLENASNSVSSIRRILTGKPEDGSSALSAIKSGLRSLFGFASFEDEMIQPEDESELHSVSLLNDAESLRETLGVHLEEALDSIAAVSSEVRKLKRACFVSIKDATENSEYDVLFELGRCTELIDQYRRIDFSSGSLASRLDGDHRRDLTKRVLSRRLP